MNSLEFIEKCIKYAEKGIKYSKKRIKENSIYPLLKQHHELELESAIKSKEALQQIKIELKAWEAVKERIIDSNGVYLLRVDSDDVDDIEYYETIKEALEIK